MTKLVLDVGNCPPDFAAIRDLVEGHFDAKVVQAHSATDSVQTLENQTVDLVLVNRKLDQDYSDGIDVIRRIKSDPSLKSAPVMLVTNYEDHQQLAIDAGAERGFGKLTMSDAATIERLAKYLR